MSGETLDALATVLAAHEGIGGDSHALVCTCGYGLGDESGDLYARHRAHVAEALLATGLIPEGTTTEEWAFKYGDEPEDQILRSGRPREWVGTHVSAEHGDKVMHRTRTTYPDRVTDWEEVQ